MRERENGAEMCHVPFPSAKLRVAYKSLLFHLGVQSEKVNVKLVEGGIRFQYFCARVMGF